MFQTKKAKLKNYWSTDLLLSSMVCQLFKIKSITENLNAEFRVFSFHIRTSASNKVSYGKEDYASIAIYRKSFYTILNDFKPF